MHILKHPLFLISASVFGVNYALQNGANIHLPFLHTYADDLACMPVVLTLALAFQRRFIYRNNAYRLSKYQVLFAWAYVALLFELALPNFSSNYTADAWDIVAYGLGAWAFYWLINCSSDLKQ